MSVASDLYNQFMNKLIPRGIRNNNPLNIKHNGVLWTGQVPPPQQTDKVFKQFFTMADGIRASFKLLTNSYVKKGHETLSEIINRWAPPVENDTRNYLAIVSKKSGLPVHHKFDVNAVNYRDEMATLMFEMIKMETGKSIPKIQIYDAIKR